MPATKYKLRGNGNTNNVLHSKGIELLGLLPPYQCRRWEEEDLNGRDDYALRQNVNYQILYELLLYWYNDNLLVEISPKKRTLQYDTIVTNDLRCIGCYLREKFTFLSFDDYYCHLCCM